MHFGYNILQSIYLGFCPVTFLFFNPLTPVTLYPLKPDLLSIGNKHYIIRFIDRELTRPHPLNICRCQDCGNNVTTLVGWHGAAINLSAIYFE
jgi:hypothetical protein